MECIYNEYTFFIYKYQVESLRYHINSIIGIGTDIYLSTFFLGLPLGLNLKTLLDCSSYIYIRLQINGCLLGFKLQMQHLILV